MNLIDVTMVAACHMDVSFPYMGGSQQESFRKAFLHAVGEGLVKPHMVWTTTKRHVQEDIQICLASCPAHLMTLLTPAHHPSTPN